jgi:hypothetical protein
MYGYKRNRDSSGKLSGMHGRLPLFPVLLSIGLLGVSGQILDAQATDQQNLPQQIQKLTDDMARAQTRLEESQRELDEMRRQLAALQQQMAQKASPASGSTATVPTSQSSSSSTAAAVDDIREHEAVQESQIATLAQSKVESESKYPVKITGLLLLNGFVNTGAVDMPATPTLALPGGGSTGASARQTILGLDARGPHLFGARSFADVRVDFDGNPQSSGGVSNVVNYAGYYNGATLLRLRTMHAILQWDRTQAVFMLDRPIFSPDSPSSLTAVSQPALSWSGNLWTWNPQLALAHDFAISGRKDLRLQTALIDVTDAPLTPVLSGPAVVPPPSGELSRWPGVEAHVSVLGAAPYGSAWGNERAHVGVGGYFAPHRTSFGYSFDSWAATLDAQLPLSNHFQLTGSFYRGLALGGLGGGGYKDFAYRYDTNADEYYVRPLDDTGGWAQLKEKLTERIELNEAFGIDNVFADELHHYAAPGNTMYQNLARNRTYTGNVIYSPSAYLLFSLEYRHLESSPVIGLPAASNIIGLGAGYKF